MRQGAEAYALLKQGAVKAMSIGFNIPTDGAAWDSDAKVLRINAIDLWETSLVTFPANPGAQITDVKHAAEAELDAVKAGRVLSAANRKKVEDARDALNAVLEAADPTEKASDPDTKSEYVGNLETPSATDRVKAAVEAAIHTIRS